MNIQTWLATDWAVLALSYRSRFDADALVDWAYAATARIRDDALQPEPFAALVTLCPKRLGTQSDLFAFIGANDGSHPLGDEGLSWLDITETQVAKGLAHFLNQDAVHGAKALLRAIEPDIPWPDHIESATIEVEVECLSSQNDAKPPRIDLAVIANNGDNQWGAVVELKIGTQRVTNPLPTYQGFVKAGVNRKTGTEYKLQSRDGSPAVFRVLAPKETDQIKRRLRHARNKDWFYLDWHGFLRRLECEIAVDSPQFRQFRKAIWDKLYV